MMEILRYNIILNSCGLIFLIPVLVPYPGPLYKKGIGAGKEQLLTYSALFHLFTLSCLIAKDTYMLYVPSSALNDTFFLIALIPAVISFLMLTAAVFTDSSGSFTLKKGRNLPVWEITFAIVPPVTALCLDYLFPGMFFTGLSWSLSLHLYRTLLMLKKEKKLKDANIQIDRDHALVKTFQMQPHFIFNTLSAIRTLCRTNPELAEECIDNLSGYLRNNIDALSSKDLIPFDEEFKHIKQYISLEQADPSRSFSFEYELDIRDFRIPALTIQPIVENAVKHGALTRTDGTGRVLLSTEVIGDYIRITIADNGSGYDGLTENEHKSRGIGIANAKDRLDTFVKGSMKISSSDEGTRVTVLIPKNNVCS
ncbi:MAG: histidine kinase [Lachnospiraceae bacterium]|nr:histidine kinase [Lachnospiraceae bacterium]